MGELVLWGWQFWKNISQVIPGFLEEFQLMVCCWL